MEAASRGLCSPTGQQALSRKEVVGSLSPMLGPTTPQQALSITTVPRAQLSEGRERRRRLEDAFVALQPARASKDQSHDAAHCPGKAHDDSRQQECAFKTPPPVSRAYKRYTAASPLRASSSPGASALQLSQTAPARLVFSPTSDTTCGTNALPEPPPPVSEADTTVRSLLTEAIRASPDAFGLPASPSSQSVQDTTKPNEATLGTDADDTVSDSASDGPGEVLPAPKMDFHKSVSFHDWLNTLVANASKPTALDGAAATTGCSPQPAADLLLAPGSRPASPSCRGGPSLLDILAASIEKRKPSKLLSKVEGSHCVRDSSLIRRSGPQHFVRGVASFSDMAAAGLQQQAARPAVDAPSNLYYS